MGLKVHILQAAAIISSIGHVMSFLKGSMKKSLAVLVFSVSSLFCVEGFAGCASDCSTNDVSHGACSPCGGYRCRFQSWVPDSSCKQTAQPIGGLVKIGGDGYKKMKKWMQFLITIRFWLPHHPCSSRVDSGRTANLWSALFRSGSCDLATGWYSACSDRASQELGVALEIKEFRPRAFLPVA